MSYTIHRTFKVQLDTVPNGTEGLFAPTPGTWVVSKYTGTAPHTFTTASPIYTDFYGNTTTLTSVEYDSDTGFAFIHLTQVMVDIPEFGGPSPLYGTDTFITCILDNPIYVQFARPDSTTSFYFGLAQAPIINNATTPVSRDNVARTVTVGAIPITTPGTAPGGIVSSAAKVFSTRHRGASALLPIILPSYVAPLTSRAVTHPFDIAYWTTFMSGPSVVGQSTYGPWIIEDLTPVSGGGFISNELPPNDYQALLQVQDDWGFRDVDISSQGAVILNAAPHAKITWTPDDNEEFQVGFDATDSNDTDDVTAKPGSIVEYRWFFKPSGVDPVIPGYDYYLAPEPQLRAIPDIDGASTSEIVGTTATFKTPTSQQFRVWLVLTDNEGDKSVTGFNIAAQPEQAHTFGLVHDPHATLYHAAKSTATGMIDIRVYWNADAPTSQAEVRSMLPGTACALWHDGTWLYALTRETTTWMQRYSMDCGGTWSTAMASPFDSATFKLVAGASDGVHEVAVGINNTTGEIIAYRSSDRGAHYDGPFHVGTAESANRSLAIDSAVVAGSSAFRVRTRDYGFISYSTGETWTGS